MITEETYIFPSSFAQQRLWLLDRIAPGSTQYNLPWLIRIEGALDVQALRKALQALTDRHESLRTTFTFEQGEAVQVVMERMGVDVPVVDLTEFGAEGEDRALRWAVEDARRPFALETAPLFRAALLQVAAGRSFLFFNFHHIVFDAWSRDVFFRELGALYAAFAEARPSPLAELPIQYADFAVWQRAWLDEARLQPLLAYWTERLTGAPETLALPTDRPRPALPSAAGAHLRVCLPPALTSGVRRLSQREGVTTFMTLLAAFAALLARLSGQTDLVIGSPTAGRTRRETEGLIGFFVNTLALRLSLAGNPTFRTVLRQARDVALGGYAHQDLPFERLVEALQPNRAVNQAPLFHTVFALRNTETPSLCAAGTDWSIVEVPSETSQFDLSLQIVDTPAELTLLFEYRTDVFDSPTIARMAGQLQTLLAGILAAPDQRLASLPLLTAAEQAQILVEWNATGHPYPADRCVHLFVEEQAARRPDALAVSAGGQQMTYAQLNRRANQIARGLRELGVGPEVGVGLCIERSLDLVACQLAVLKSGGFYVPIDPSYPEERIGYMLEDARVAVLISRQPSAAALPARTAQFCLAAEAERIAGASAENLDVAVRPDNLAYVIYTSGSTGRPKGVEIQHRGLINLVTWHQRSYALLPSDRATLLASPSFDASVWETWPYLALGASLHVPDDEIRADPPRLIAWLDQQAITLSFMPTALAEALFAHPWPGTTALRALLVGGDLLHHGASDDLPFALYNHYGPTENTVVATWARVARRADGEARPPIGRPIANNQVYVLDRHLNPVPVGVPGELYVGGDGLARGYLGRPDLTAERFVPNPFADHRPTVSDNVGAGRRSPILNSQFSILNSRLYRTGDLVCYRPDGQIVFLERIDQQVKIRGFRIELGELEAVLSQHPAVEEAVVLARQDTPGQTRLVAYVVPRNPGDTPVSAELRQYLAGRLPDYMVPSAVVTLLRLPLTPNGKVDRKALPAPSLEALTQGAERVAPRDAVEERLVAIWAEVLNIASVDGRPPISIHDSFFALGGHSLLATQVASRLREVFEIELPLRRLFETPTVAGLAEAVSALLRAGRPASAAELRPISRSEPPPLSFAQQRLWFLQRLEPDNPFYNLPLTLRLTGPLDTLALERSLGALVARHEVLRTIFDAVNGQPVQVVLDQQQVALQRYDLTHLAPAARQERASALIAQAARTPFDLSRGPLLRADLLQTAPDERLLLLTMHHIVSDGWSVKILFDEFTALYESYRDGCPATLAALPIQYADFAAWQRAVLSEARVRQLLAYWTERLRGAPEALVLPADRPRPAVQRYQGAHCRTQLPPGLTVAVRALSQREGVTPFMTLLAAFAVLLARLTSQTDLVIGSPIAGRTRRETEGLIGFFINTLALRLDLTGNPTFRDLLGQTRDVALGAYTHQDLPFERLVEELHPQRDLSRTPIVQVFFQLFTAPIRGRSLSELRLEPIDPPILTSKFDLELQICEDGGEFEAIMLYNSDLFEPSTVARWMGHYQTLLEDIAGDADRRLSDLRLLSAAERRSLLAGLGAAPELFPAHTSFLELFDESLRRGPGAPALAYEGQQLCFAELDARSNRLAHHLRQLGVGPDVVVGLWTERSLDLIVGMLGIWKAGGAYLPVDPGCPRERLAAMLEDAAAPVLVTQAEFAERAPALAARLVRLDTDAAVIAAYPDTRPALAASQSNLAYVIYTSGSTGRPKGVGIEHRQLLNYTQSMIGRLGLPRGASYALLSSVAADLGNTVIFPALSTGGCLHLIAQQRVADPNALAEYLGAHPVDCIKIVPSHLAALLTAARAEHIPPRRCLVLGGEAASWELVARVRQLSPGTRVLNHYGPTETTVGALTWPVPEEPRPDAATVPLGRPIANTQLYILDQWGQPTPPGVAGELYIGGAGVARGYLGRPDLTAERFVPNPFADQRPTTNDQRPTTNAGAFDEGRRTKDETEARSALLNSQFSILNSRLYRTGDLVRCLADGAVEFLGRIDDQVKIRGFRIELREIEATLCQVPGVREALTLAREDAPGARRLVAYLTAEGAQPSASELRGFLKEKLPDYMTPAAFVWLESFPRLANGKINRAALPAPESGRPALEQDYIAPQTGVEQDIAGVWKDVLGVAQVGLEDNFFDLGGHSLLMIHVQARLQQVFQRDIALIELFRYPTVRSLARALAQAQEQFEAAPMIDRANSRRESLAGQRQLRQQRSARNLKQ